MSDGSQNASKAAGQTDAFGSRVRFATFALVLFNRRIKRRASLNSCAQEPQRV